jgi:predicted nuclease of predicted toxin-antitoxin system
MDCLRSDPHGADYLSMPATRFLAGMNISPKTVQALRQQGWDIVRVPELLPVNSTDAEILDFARHEQRVVVTQDLDFSALLALGGHDRPSLVTLRLSVSDPETVTRRLLEVLPRTEQMLQEGCVVTVDEVSVRVRKLPIRLP